jgi:HAD superfamily hydrolase (TIGR01450 family)
VKPSGLRRARRALAAARGFLFDLDGTLALTDAQHAGHQPLPGAIDLLAALRARRIPFAIYTNGTAHVPEAIAGSLRRAGFALAGDEVITPASVAAEIFRARAFGRVLVLGGEGVQRPLREAGIEVVAAPARADDAGAVLVGWYPQFTLKDMEAACHAVWAGAPLYTVSKAPFFATAAGRTLGVSGAIVAAIRSITGRRATVIGKPAVHGLRIASRHFGVPVARIAVVGDDPILEVAMAHAGGALAVAVQTGLADAAALARLPAGRRPDLVIEGVRDLLRLLA